MNLTDLQPRAMHYDMAFLDPNWKLVCTSGTPAFHLIYGAPNYTTTGRCGDRLLEPTRLIRGGGFDQTMRLGQNTCDRCFAGVTPPLPDSLYISSAQWNDENPEYEGDVYDDDDPIDEDDDTDDDESDELPLPYTGPTLRIPFPA